MKDLEVIRDQRKTTEEKSARDSGHDQYGSSHKWHLTHDMLRTILPVGAHESHQKKRQALQMEDLSSGRRT